MISQDEEDYKIQPETPEETEARLERILDAWGDGDITQLSLAGVFEMRFDGQLWPDEYRFDPHRGHWMEWKGGRWEGHWTRAATIMTDVGRLIERLCGDQPSLASKWSKVNVYRDVLTLAKETMTVDQWDTEGDLMGLPCGDVWDLETGIPTPNFRRWPISKTTGVDPAECQGETCKLFCKCLWHTFLYEVTGGDKGMIQGLQLSVGASLFAGNRDHKVHLICGDGGTGKSLFLNTVAKALGDYAGAMPASVLAGKGNDHPTGLAGIVDKRFVAVQEVTGDMWKEEALKTISGGDFIPVRFMRQDFFTVKPECTLWMSTNQPPNLRQVDNSIKRRLRIWPFEHKPTEVDTRLGEKLQEPDMLGRVLQWALRGAWEYNSLEGEIDDCQAVLQATKEYFDEADTIGAWLQACTTPSQIPEHDTGAATLFKHYLAWCESESQYYTNRTAWGKRMSREVSKRRGNRGHLYAVELESVGLSVGSVHSSSVPPTPIKGPDSATKQGRF